MAFLAETAELHLQFRQKQESRAFGIDVYFCNCVRIIEYSWKQLFCGETWRDLYVN